MTLLVAALLGIIQGLTEFLPVSSTAHLIIAARLLAFEDPGGVFTVMIQLGSILAVMWLYRAKIIRIVMGLPSDPDARRFAAMILLAFLPAVLAGAFLADYVTNVLYASPKVIATTFVLGGIVMLAVERYRPVPDVLDADRTPFTRALGIGLCQVLALVPGVSRSGATIVGGMLMGLDRPAAAEFSFFLAMPTMMAAFAHSPSSVFALTAARSTSPVASLGMPSRLAIRSPCVPLPAPGGPSKTMFMTRCSWCEPSWRECPAATR